MGFVCSSCLEDVDDHYLQEIVGDDPYCDVCWPKVSERVLALRKRYKELGHTGSDMCGCSMCAARFEAM